MMCRPYMRTSDREEDPVLSTQTLPPANPGPVNVPKSRRAVSNPHQDFRVLQPERTCIALLGGADLSQHLAELGPALALEQHEAPGHELLMVGNTRGCAQHQLEFGRTWPRLAEAVG